MIVTTAQLYKVAYGKFAVGAYNVNNMEQMLGLFRGNAQSKAPFIIQLSKGARKYAGKRMLEAMIRTAEEIFPETIFAVHLDHGDEETCDDCGRAFIENSFVIIPRNSISATRERVSSRSTPISSRTRTRSLVRRARSMKCARVWRNKPRSCRANER